MMSQNNDLKKTLIKSNKATRKLKSDQQQHQQQTYVKDPEQECSRSKIKNSRPLFNIIFQPLQNAGLFSQIGLIGWLGKSTLHERRVYDRPIYNFSRHKTSQKE